MEQDIKLTQYSHGAGCGCKIAPKVLDTILHSEKKKEIYAELLVGNEDKDDAAVYDLGNGTAIISTTDFFMPIVDDPFTFGQIAATNAISDIYAMGGKPLMAIAILGWPINKISAEVAQKVLEGGRTTCSQASIPLAGGHSIDSPEPIFGLAVTGIVNIKHLKKNNAAKTNNKLFLTKPLGVGILATAQKKGLLESRHTNIAPKIMTQLNSIGEKLSRIEGVTAMTDVTGFGFLGHLTEICEGSNLSAIVEFEKIPIIPEIYPYIEKECVPGGMHRNWASYGHKIQLNDELHKTVLCDAQTSGGLLIAVANETVEEIQNILHENNMSTIPLGYFTEKGEATITVK